MKYYTIDSEVSFKQRYLDNIIIKQTEPNWFVYFIVLMGLVFYSIFSFPESKDSFKIFEAIFFLSLSYKYWVKIYNYLFVYSHKKYIKYDEIVSVTKKDLDNNIETEVILTLKNKRKRVYTFRTAENVVDSFINELKDCIQTK